MKTTYPSSEKIYVSGDINNVQVGMRKIKLSETVLVDENGEKNTKNNNPVVVYDTSGPYSDPKVCIDLTEGLPRFRDAWYKRRKDIVRPKGDKSIDKTSQVKESSTVFPKKHQPYKGKEGKIITQLYYAKRRIITQEMEYVAIRENQQVEALGLKSYITPEFVRKEIAAGRAVIPANVNHPEAEPMIIGRKFLVKVNANIDIPKSISSIEDIIEKVIWSCKWGSDTLTETSNGNDLQNTREWLIRNTPVPYSTVPLYQALDKVNGEISKLTWAIYRETLIEQAEQGVDCFNIHAGLLRRFVDMTNTRLTGIASPEGSILAEWMQIHDKENFLYTHFEDICDILNSYDITLSIGNGLRPGSIYDANDSSQFAELQTIGKLTKVAWSHYVQVIVEGQGHVPMNKIKENIKEQQYACHDVPFYTLGPLTTDLAPGYDHIAAAIGAAQVAWNGISMLCSITPKFYLGIPNKEDIRNSIIAFKIAAHAADIAKEHPGAQVRDNALSKARVDNRWKDVCHLSLDPERALLYSRDRNKK